MSMSSKIKIINTIDSTIIVTAMNKLNDDAVWIAPRVGTSYKKGESFTITVENDSFTYTPQGVGFKFEFVCIGNSKMGGIVLDDPGIGEHHFGFKNAKTFDYPIQNPKGDDYVIEIALLN